MAETKVDWPALQTLDAVFRRHAAARPTAPAFVFPSGKIISWGSFLRDIEQMGAALARAGIGAGDCVAIVMPTGAELAITIAAVSCHATAMPLDPALTATEFDALFLDQRIGAVIFLAGVDSAGSAAANRHEICRFDASFTSDAVQLSLRASPAPKSVGDRAIGPDTPAVILRTSGTTARSKLVPVTHRNLLETAAAIEEWFQLRAADRVLCVMPLYYAVGLRVALLTSLITGGSVACAPAALEARFLDYITALEPTWYSGGPTLHHAVLERARALGESRRNHSLRFIHSGAAPLPISLHEGLEALFGVPVLQTYGLSEAGLVAANSTTPGGRRIGTVGKRRPGELEIRGEDGSILGANELGEIVARGPCVTPGYIDAPELNRTAFAGGWFCTGDLGRIDADGFVTVVGRIKDLINRGGAKISPSEVDEALLQHPAVTEAAAFAVPHARLGEDIAAAIVLRRGQAASPLEIRRFLQGMLAPHKIPRRIHIVEELPKNASGKVLRQDLSAKHGADLVTRPSSSWASPLEVQIAEIWQRLLGKEVGRDDAFFDLGGDSLLASQMLLEIEHLTARILPESLLFETATVRELAQSIVQSDVEEQSLVVELQPGQGRPPFIFVDGDFWGGGYYTRKLAQLLGPEYPFYDLRSHGLYADNIPSIEQMAQAYLSQLVSVQPHGPYRIGGHCNGALIAWEMARRFEMAGERVELLALIEPITLNARISFRVTAQILDLALRVAPESTRREAWHSAVMSFIWRAIRKVNALRLDGRKIGFGDDLAARAARISEFNAPAADRYVWLQRQFGRAMARYIPTRVAADILCLVAESHRDDYAFSTAVCRRLAARCDSVAIPGEHMTCITSHAEALAGVLRDRFAALDEKQA